MGEHETLTVGQLAQFPRLDSGTLFPLLKRLQAQGWYAAPGARPTKIANTISRADPYSISAGR
ncbi:DNA-binding PadR family transcriptional regulator [Pseudonocardia eucalypti]|uniref:hypothetical protein n=1 Tax=Pseudonocardia eucalypti TaxID=648755 RepID=UPI00161B1C67|nr:DNA-binding PadR family transcriptional regulator [Pseudonocardia eucalypti]